MSKNEDSMVQARKQLIMYQKQRLEELVKEREQLARHVFRLTHSSNALRRLPSVEDVDEDEFRAFMDQWSMTREAVNSMDDFDWAYYPPIEPLLPALEFEPFQDEDFEMDETQEFNSQYRLKLDWTNIAERPMTPPNFPTFSTDYSASLPLPPLNSLSLEQPKRVVPQKTGKKREKLKESKVATPSMDFNRWHATLTHNPAYKLVRKASKCLSTSEWNVATQELILFRTFERIEELKNENKWSFRQPRRHKDPSVIKDHWSYLLDEARWMQADFREERKWKMAIALELSEAALEWCLTPPDDRMRLRGYFRPPVIEEPIERGVPQENTMEIDPEPNVDREAEPVEDEVMEEEFDNEEDDDEPEITIKPKADIEPVIVPNDDNALVPESDVYLIPKTEDTENTVPGLTDPNSMEVDSAEADTKETVGTLQGDSKNPMLTEEPAMAVAVTIVDNHKAVRQPVVNLDATSLWVDPRKLDPIRRRLINESVDSGEFEDNIELEPGHLPGWDEVFPDLPLYTMPEGLELEQMPDQRREELVTGAVPISRFANMKPLLIGALQPAAQFDGEEWHPVDEPPVTYDEGTVIKNGSTLFDHFDVPYLIKLPQSLFERGIPPHEKPPKWNTAEDNFLKKLAEELQFNWPLIADTFNFLRHALITEKRTAIHCYLRYASVWGDHGDGSANKTAISIDADDKNSAAVPPEARPQKHRIFEEWAPTLPNDNFDPKYLRHKFVHRAIKKTMKRRDELMKEKDYPHRVLVPHQSHEQYMKMKTYTPIELGRHKREKEERQQAELKRRQLEQQAMKARFIQAQQQQLAAGMAGAIPNGVSSGMTGIPNGMQNLQINGAQMQVVPRLPGTVPNISQQIPSAQRPSVEMAAPISQAMLMLQHHQQQHQQQQQQQQQRMVALGGNIQMMSNGGPARPQSAASILSQGAAASALAAGTPPQVQMLSRTTQMPDGSIRTTHQMHPGTMVQGMPMVGLPPDAMALYQHQFRQTQIQQAQAQAQARAAVAAQMNNAMGMLPNPPGGGI